MKYLGDEVEISISNYKGKKFLLISDQFEDSQIYIANPKEEIPKIIECLQRFQKELK